MSYLPVLLLGLLALVNLFVSAFLLWLSCKLCRVRRGVPSQSEGSDSRRVGIPYKRALGVVLAFTFCGLLVVPVLWFLAPPQSDSFPWFETLALVFHLLFLYVFVRAFVASSLGKAVLVGLLWQVLGGLFAVVFVLTVSNTLIAGFIVPTGSMAHTLRGYHKDIRCPTCSFEFPINCSREVDVTEGRPLKTFACVCPNCRQRIHFASAPAHYKIDEPGSIEIADPGPSGGDRILVGRGLLGPRLIAPRRFEVFAHYYPSRPTLLFTKRLIGLPGETIAIKGGDLYVLRPDQGLQYDDNEPTADEPGGSAAEAPNHADDPEALRRFEKGQFELLRKSPEQILTLRHIVYDNDRADENQPARWEHDDGWIAGDEHSFESAAANSAEKTFWLRYRHILADHDGKPALITDCTGYNTYQDNFHQPLLGNNWVGDLLLECEADIDDPRGEFTLELSKGVDRFRARWDLASGTCTLLRLTSKGEKKLDSKPTAFGKKGEYRLRFANVDERLAIWVNEELPFGDGVSYSPSEQIGPDEKNDLEPAGIATRGVRVQVRKLKLFRDVYYTAGERPNEPDVPGVDCSEPFSWDGLRHPPLRTYFVSPGRFFVLGDNSSESSDSRSWGAVPDRLLLGRVFFVYYPWKRIGPLR